MQEAPEVRWGVGGRALSARVGAMALGLMVVAWPIASAWAQPQATSSASTELTPCTLRGVSGEALCGVVPRPLDPARPQGTRVDIHFAVLPAVARNKRPDPVVFFAGGPGQSAIELAGPIQAMLARFGNRRDIVLIDQRGTGRSAPLVCDEPSPWRPLVEQVDEMRAIERLKACGRHLQTLPHGDLRFYTTPIAMADADAVLQRLGVMQANLIGASYGTRAALEYLRQFPQRVRSLVLDGVAPADMGMTASFSADNQAALDAMFDACARDAACHARFPTLRASWRELLVSVPKPVSMTHPLSFARETVTLTRGSVLGAVRGALYVPSLTAMLPASIDAAARGRFEPLFALASALGRRTPMSMSEGMHFSVVCTEDAPPGTKQDASTAGTGERAGADFGLHFEGVYRQVCEGWPRGELPTAFATMGPSPAPVLVLSGGDDPVTPPRHGARVAQRLGAKARHVVVPHAGHGVLSLGCMRDAVFRFVDGADAGASAKGVREGGPEVECAAAMPRAAAFRPAAPAAATAPASAPTGAAR